jgi:hypothetical protein
VAVVAGAAVAERRMPVEVAAVISVVACTPVAAVLVSVEECVPVAVVRALAEACAAAEGRTSAAVADVILAVGRGYPDLLRDPVFAAIVLSLYGAARPTAERRSTPTKIQNFVRIIFVKIEMRA